MGSGLSLRVGPRDVNEAAEYCLGPEWLAFLFILLVHSVKEAAKGTVKQI